jgi:hypothetical protein
VRYCELRERRRIGTCKIVGTWRMMSKRRMDMVR